MQSTQVFSCPSLIDDAALRARCVRSSRNARATIGQQHPTLQPATYASASSQLLLGLV